MNKGSEKTRHSRGIAAIPVLALCALVPWTGARADTTNAIYRGHDLGLPIAQAIAQIQATGSSRGQHVTLSISGSGEQLMFTEVNPDTIETETASYKNLMFEDIDVRKIGQAEGRYGMTLRAVPGTVNDHVVGTDADKPRQADRDGALGYMDFWLVDADTSRIRHLADLFATIGARLREQGLPEQAPPSKVADVDSSDAEVPHDAAAAVVPAMQLASSRITVPGPVVQPAPRTPVLTDDENVSPVSPADIPRKCLYTDQKIHQTRHHGRAMPSSPRWSAIKVGLSGGNGRISYKISPLAGEDSRQKIQFYLSNLLPVQGTVIARVILSASDGSQQALDLGVDDIAPHNTVSNDSLTKAPFDESVCITDVDITQVQACPVSDESQASSGSDPIYGCNEAAASGTVTIDGITYVKGREPKMLTAADAQAATKKP